MTREEAKQLLPVIQAFAEGKTIEYFSESDGWRKTQHVSVGFDAPPSRYRVKPEPLECWVNVIGSNTQTYFDHDQAIRMAMLDPGPVRTVHFREVI